MLLSLKKCNKLAEAPQLMNFKNLVLGYIKNILPMFVILWPIFYVTLFSPKC